MHQWEFQVQVNDRLVNNEDFVCMWFEAFTQRSENKKMCYVIENMELMKGYPLRGECLWVCSRCFFHHPDNRVGTKFYLPVLNWQVSICSHGHATQYKYFFGGTPVQLSFAHECSERISFSQVFFWFGETLCKSERLLNQFCTQKNISSGVDNWYLDEFFEEFICGRWYTYLEQTIYHLCRPISCWISSVVDDKLCCMIFVSSRQYLTKADDTPLTGTIFI
jgi:hypothetical protein